jgi:DNA-binding CsgD family transcriptional regulator
VLLDEARRGRSGVLAVVGEPGVGKTALLDEVRRQATDLHVLEATGVESESELPYAALHELLRPLLDLLPRIPDTQARALAAALALEPGKPDAFAVGAGTLSLLAEAAEQQPLLVLLDDAHWLDHASADALVFAARRFRLEPIALVAAYRPGEAPTFEPLPRLELEPLSPDDARSVLRSRPEPVAPRDEVDVLAAAAGNPLALLELPVDLSRDIPAAAETLHERLRRAFSARVEELPPSGRLGLLLAAAEPDAGTVRRAAEVLRLDAPLAPAEAVGLIRIRDGSLAFRHPVVRSLVYANAPTGDRATAHRALAASLTEDEDADRRAWHLAAAADEPDESVAALLEQTAERAIARGGHAAAARALERSARLSPAREDRARRLAAAFQSQRYSGDRAKAHALAEEALTLAEDPGVRADLLFQLQALADWGDERASDSELLREVETSAELDDEGRAKLLLLVVMRRSSRWDASGAVALCPRLEEYAAGSGPVWRQRAVASAAMSYLRAGDRPRAERLFGALERTDIPTIAAFDYMSLEWYDRLRESLAETLRAARADGNIHRIAWNRTCAAHLELRHGRLDAAEAAAAEALPLGEAISERKIDLAAAALAGVQAWRGQSEACVANARRAAAAARVAEDLYGEGIAQMQIALLALGEGRPRDAIAELEPLAKRWLDSTVRDPATVAFVTDLVEAYALTEATDKARGLLDRFSPIADAAGNKWMLAARDRCEGVLATAEELDTPFTSALQRLEGSPYALERARTRLAYGERLRRARRLRDARPHLQAAFDAFDAAGATLWQERAAAELRAAGVRVASESRPRADLTPQELHIAGLVAEGKTNKEIAAAMYVSPKTVEHHLTNAYRKLDIHSRAELVRIVSRDG